MSINETMEIINVIMACLIDSIEFEFPLFPASERARMRRRRIFRPAVSAAPHLEMLRGENPSPLLLSWRRGACVTPRRAGHHGGVSRLYIDTQTFPSQSSASPEPLETNMQVQNKEYSESEKLY